MIFNGALVTERGITFGIFITHMHILNNRPEANKLVQKCEEEIFPGHPVVLMAQDSRGIPRYYGRQDITRFLASIDVRRIPFKRFTITE